MTLHWFLLMTMSYLYLPTDRSHSLSPINTLYIAFSIPQKL